VDVNDGGPIDEPVLAAFGLEISKASTELEAYPELVSSVARRKLPEIAIPAMLEQ
jgi:hypothetical protein